MNHLFRDLAPVSEAAWAEIEEESTRTLKHFLTGRRLVDFVGPDGWAKDSVSTGHVEDVKKASRGHPRPAPHAAAARRVPRRVLARPSADSTRSTVVHATSTSTRCATPPATSRWPRTTRSSSAIPRPASSGSRPSHRTRPLPIGDDYGDYPRTVARAVALLQRDRDRRARTRSRSGRAAYTGVIETTEMGGYPILEHLA